MASSERGMNPVATIIINPGKETGQAQSSTSNLLFSSPVGYTRVQLVKTGPGPHN